MDQQTDTGLERKLPTNTKAYFIKLGERGFWEKKCLKDGTLWFGYNETPHDMCLRGDWGGVQAFWKIVRKKEGTASNDARQIRTFYEADEHSIFITFHGGYLWWCKPKGRAAVIEDDARLRQTVDGWKRESIGGDPLIISRLSGKLTKTQMFRGTICEVAERAYLLRRINDEPTPEVAVAEEAEVILRARILAMVQLLDPKDFELLVELIFSSSGWRRQTRTGGTQKTIDLDLLLPTTGERAFVQIKSKTSGKEFESYAKDFRDTDAHARMFFVWHTGKVNVEPTEQITLWGPDEVPKMVLEAGLLSWLKDKAS
ncbi:hypothetical protein [Rhodanobacter sp. C03]|uniref:hypothetical protein n=1 Tax=Rhodanobacter sp. C03 TaxID=1945858 RepID=UPI0009850FDA|nr:hypothetical protein [Rhodanobacter sp. C03]OOG60391.1 hypothetical protein B0E48_03910 [Rhodanobacter sp. C03]